MEMGSNSFGGGSDTSLDGLTFGKKIYFEDVGSAVSAKSGGGSTSASAMESGGGSGPMMSRKGRGAGQGGVIPRCQVEGCQLDLSEVKAYYSRHKVCSMHSKSPKVIVGGLEQRFCQQCSRFHLLHEFDQGKRSCRRRLAGHNERRRKPQPGSLYSSRYGRESSFQENGSRAGGFLMDFTSYSRTGGRDGWPAIKHGNWADGNQLAPTGKFLPHQWQGHPENPSGIVYPQVASHPYLQGVAGGTVFSSARISSDECFAGVSDSSCALSLLSNQTWDPRNQTSDLEVHNAVNCVGGSVARSTAPHSAVVTNMASNTWSFKENSELGGSSHEMSRGFVLGHMHPGTHHFSGELELAQQGDRQYMELGHPRDFGSSTQMHWSL